MTPMNNPESVALDLMFSTFQFAVSYSCPISPMHPTMTGVIPHATTSKLYSPQPTSVPTFAPASTATDNPTNTEQSVSEPAPTVTISTDQSAVGAQIAAAVVPASTVIVIILLTITLFLVGVGVYKRQNVIEAFQDTQGNTYLAAKALTIN